MHRLNLVRRSEAVLPVEFCSESGPLLREFRIREQTPAEMVEHYDRYERSREEAIHLLAGKDAESKEAMAAYCRILVPSAHAILQDPVDELPPPSLEDVSGLTYVQLVEIVSAQEQITHLEEHLGNAHRLLAEAKLQKDRASGSTSSKRARKSPARAGRQTRSTR